jgi:hypothetical protein
MNEIPNPNRRHISILSTTLLASVFATAIGGLSGCSQPIAIQATIKAPPARDVIGLTEAELRAKYPEVAELSVSFSILASKHLHPYHPPATNKLLRFGREYLVAELKDGRVIALHQVSG